MSVERIIEVSRSVPSGRWTSYQEVGEVVYGHRLAGQPVGNALRAQGHEDSAHRTLLADGRVSPFGPARGEAPTSAFVASARKVCGMTYVAALAQIVSLTQTRSVVEGVTTLERLRKAVALPARRHRPRRLRHSSGAAWAL